MHYTHLTRETRYQIAVLQGLKLSQSAIAQRLNCHKSTISREVRRNALESGAYDPGAADASRVQRRSASAKANAKRIPEALRQEAKRYIRANLSPEQASGRLKLEGSGSVSHESLYRMVYQDKAQGGDLHTHLRCQKRYRKRYASGRDRRGQIKNRVCIEQRDPIVNERSRIGDWEGDTVIGKGHQGALVTLVERKSRFALAAHAPNRMATAVAQSIIDMLRPYKEQCLTITFDNGKEFSDHAYIAKCLKTKVFFAHPYRSWERGLNENTNGLLRQYFPKSMPLHALNPCDVEAAVYQLNHRPRKCLGYRTPHEVFFGFDIVPMRL